MPRVGSTSGFRMKCLKPGDFSSRQIPRGVIVHPRCYSSKRIVIERIHTVVLTKSILYCIRVQTLPNRRGSILYRIKPGRITLVLQQTVSLLGHTIIRKCLTDPSGTDKTRQERISRITGHRSLDGCSEMSRHLLL